MLMWLGASSRGSHGYICKEEVKIMAGALVLMYGKEEISVLPETMFGEEEQWLSTS